MRLSRPSLALLLPLLLLVGWGSRAARPLQGQIPPLSDARLPRPGQVWFEVAPIVESWHEQFAAGSESVSEGSKEPLFADLDGGVFERLFPGPGPLLDELNAGSDSLGFEPVGPEGLSLGRLDFRDLTARRVELPLRLRVGVLDRLAVEASVPLVRTEMEAAFSFDSAGATAAPAPFALPGGSTFVDDLSAARAELQGRLDQGSLDPGQEAAAMQLLQETGAFLAVLRRRLQASALLPLGGSAAGGAMTQRVADFQESFGSFDIDAPALELADAVTGAALQAFFVGGFLQADSLQGRSQSFDVGEPVVGLRFALLDSYGRESDAGGGDEGVTDGEGEGGESPAGTTGGRLRLRTTVAARVRFAPGRPDESPFLTPGVFLDLPAGDGSTDLELAAFQDLEFRRFSASAAAAYGLQTSDELTLRVHPPDRPFALAATERRLERELGDYLSARLSSRFALESAVRIAAEYAFWHKGSDRYRLLSPGSGNGNGNGSGDTVVESADPLELETEETRHTLGFGIYYTPAGEAAGGRSGSVEVGVLYQRSVAGSGGQTPAPEVVAVRVRVPVQLF